MALTRVSGKVAKNAVTTIDDLPDSGYEGQLIDALGYLSAGDGGGGTFRYTVTAGAVANGGTIFNPALDYSSPNYNSTAGTGAWYRQYSGAVNVQWFGCIPSQTATVQTAAAQAARDYADSLTTDAIVYFPAGSYIINGELAQQATGSFKGVSFVGDGSDTTLIEFQPATAASNLFTWVGGSGQQTNKRLRGISIAAYSGYEGNGVGLLVDGQDFGICDDVNISNLAIGVQLANVSNGAFTEFNTFSNMRLLDNTKAISYWVYGDGVGGGGNVSFHGNRFLNIQINIPASGYGIHSDRTAASGADAGTTNYIYNNTFTNVNMFGGTGTRYAIWTDKTNTDNCSGNFTCEDAVTLHAEANSEFQFDGHFYSISTVNITGSGIIRCYDRSTTSTFTHGSLNTVSPVTGDLWSYNAKNNGDFPIIGRYIGAGVDGIFHASYADSGHLFGQVAFSGTIQDYSPAFYLSGNGSVIQYYHATGFDFKDVNNNPILSLKNGRAYGYLGKQESIAVSIAATSASTTIVVSEPAIINNVSIRLHGANYEWRQLYACNHEGFGGAGTANLIAAGHYLNATAGAVTDPSAVAVNSDGTITVSGFTTTQTLTLVVTIL